MSFFRDLDLYKVIILVSLLLLPGALGFVYWVEGQLETARTALAAAERPRSGELEKIGVLQRQLETVAQNAAAVRTSGGSAAVFFQNQISTSSSGTISSNDYEVSPEVRSGVPGRRDAQDQVVKLSFRKDLRLPRALVHALAFNVESSGAQIWKLRRLQVRNAELAKLRAQAPPKTVADDWELVALEFARREPAAQR
jgi:hypothetical protein